MHLQEVKKGLFNMPVLLLELIMGCFSLQPLELKNLATLFPFPPGIPPLLLRLVDRGRFDRRDAVQYPRSDDGIQCLY